jgi:hypothetical protein
VDDPLVDLARANPALTATILVGFVVLARVFAAAGFDIPRAVALATSADPGAALIGIITTSVPAQLPVIALLFFWWRQAYYAAGRRAAVLTIAEVTAVTAVVFVTPWPITVLFGGGLIIARFLAPRLQRRFDWTARPRLGLAPVDEALTIVAGSIVFFLTSAVMWLPAQRLDLASGPVFGFVIAQDSGFTTVLRQDDRTVIYIRTTDITARSLCAIGGGLGPPLVELARPPAPLPTCP